MGTILARKHNTKNTKFNHIKGSGLIPRGPICTIDSCLPKPLATPKKPIPRRITRNAPDPLIAIKKSPKDNKWYLNGVRYPNFNSLCVNIPGRSFTVLRTNGKT